ncbi:MAG TPA: ABC transporter ATP-binding protein [Candidatus Dormibacteraeota bacterium]|nr:ABC transporter ATP-binding protein [Candidatus Dormibacteraeota bacterium]
MEDAAVVDHATKRFGDVVAVDDISFRVRAGTILGVIGPSGSGKTTTIRLLTGALAPSDGAVSVLGEDPRRFRGKTRQRLGYMPQLFTLYPDLTARENVDFVASLYGLLLFRRRRRVEDVLRLVDLWDARSRRAGRMSGGMQRRLELACALVHDPVLALLDEPTAGIDPLLRASIWTELRRLRDEGRTLLVTTQYVGEAEECDQVALMAEGHLVALADPETLRRKATGGDILHVATGAPYDGSGLTALPDVRAVERLDDRRLRLTVRDAATDTPAILEAVEAAGVQVAGIEEQRPSFDEVFATLVERDREVVDAPVPPTEATPA